MNRLWWAAVALGVSVIFNAIGVKVGRGSYDYIMLVLQVILFVGAPLFIASIVVMVMGRHERPRLFLAGYVLNLASMVVGLMVVSCFIGLSVADSDVKDTKAWCGQFPRWIEKFRQDNGRLPETRLEFTGDVALPRLLDDEQFYFPHGDTYTFEFRNPSKRRAVVVYDSATGVWQERE
jgi:hypothetical protein